MWHIEKLTFILYHIQIYQRHLTSRAAENYDFGLTGDEAEEDLALEQVKEAEGEAQVQVEVTVAGKRLVRKRKLAEHEDATVSILGSAQLSWKELLNETGKAKLHNAVYNIPTGILCS